MDPTSEFEGRGAPYSADLGESFRLLTKMTGWSTQRGHVFKLTEARPLSG